MWPVLIFALLGVIQVLRPFPWNTLCTIGKLSGCKINLQLGPGYGPLCWPARALNPSGFQLSSRLAEPLLQWLLHSSCQVIGSSAKLADVLLSWVARAMGFVFCFYFPFLASNSSAFLCCSKKSLPPPFPVSLNYLIDFTWHDVLCWLAFLLAGGFSSETNFLCSSYNWI